MSGGDVTKGGFGEWYAFSHPDWKNTKVSLKTGMARQIVDKEVCYTDFFNFRAMVKNCTREEAIEQTRELVDKLETVSWEEERAKQAKLEKQGNLVSKDRVSEAFFPENSSTPWYGTEGQLRKVIERYYECPVESLGRLLEDWETSSDRHRFIVTNKIWRDKKGHVRLRRFILTPTGVDTRLEEAKLETAKYLGISEEDREIATQRLYDRALEEEARLA
jgi:hypothetical protein